MTTTPAPPNERVRLIPDPEQVPTVGLDVACPALGIGATTGYELARTGQLAAGVPVIRVRGKYRIPTAALRRALGLDGNDAA